MKINEKMDRGFYVAGWCLIMAAAAMWVFVKISGSRLFSVGMPCTLHLITGYYCPGCGGTRAVAALLHGKFLLALFYHPFVPYAAVLGGWFMISQTIERISQKRIKIGMHFRECFLWIALGIILINMLIKNLVLGVWQVDLLALRL